METVIRASYVAPTGHVMQDTRNYAQQVRDAVLAIGGQVQDSELGQTKLWLAASIPGDQFSILKARLADLRRRHEAGEVDILYGVHAREPDDEVSRPPAENPARIAGSD